MSKNMFTTNWYMYRVYMLNVAKEAEASPPETSFEKQVNQAKGRKCKQAKSGRERCKP